MRQGSFQTREKGFGLFLRTANGFSAVGRAGSGATAGAASPTGAGRLATCLVALVSFVLVLGCTSTCWSQAYQQNISVTWDFTTAAGPLGWSPIAPLSGFGVENGALTFRATEQDDIVYSPAISVPTAPLQLVEIVMSSNTAGAAEIFWAPAQTGVYNGFEPGDENDFVMIGDGAFHHYFLPINTASATTIYGLRLDVPPSATVSIQSVTLANLVAPAGPGVAPLWQFTTAGNTQGWVPYQGVFDMSVSGGNLNIQTYSNATILAPSAEVTNQLEWFSLMGTVTQTSLDVPWIQLNFASTANNGASTSVYFPVVPDSAAHVYNENVGGASGWYSSVSQLSITIPENTTVAIGQIQVSSAPQGLADVAVDAFGPASSLIRAGSPFQVSCRVSDRGAQPVQGLAVNLNLPTGGGVTVISSPSIPTSLSSGYPQTLVWTLMASQAGSIPISVSLTAQTGGSAQSSDTILVNPVVTAQSSPYVPRPVPVSSNYDVGVYYFPGWSLYSHWDPIRNFPDRMPVLGYYAEGDPQILDWQIKWAVEHGVRFFAVDWYWGSSALPATERGEWPNNFLQAYSSSVYRGYVGFCIVYADDNVGDTASGQADFLNITQAWINEYFSRPEYYKINQTPVVILTNPSQLDAELGGSAKQALEAARQLARQAGFNGIYFVAAANTADVSQLVSDGYDALSAYNYPSAGTFDPDQDTYSSMVAGYASIWDPIIAASSVPYVIPTTSGFDNTPWAPYDAPFELVRTGPTPDEFQQMLQMAKSRIDAGKAPGIVLVEAWNELGEGSYVEPTAGQGFGYLDAIRNIFVGNSAHTDLAPSDVALPLLQPLPSAALWTFTQASDLLPWLDSPGPPFNSWTVNVSDSQITNNQWTFTSNGQADLSRSSFEISALDYSAVAIRMSVSGDASVGLYWGAVDEPGSSALRSMFFGAQAGAMQTYTLTLAGQAGWRGIVNLVRLTISSSANVNVAIESIEFLSSSTTAAIAITKTQLQFNWVPGTAAPAPQTVSVASATGASLALTATTSAPWLALSPTSGTAPTVLVVSVSPTALTVGVYNASVTIAGAGAANSTGTISVTLWVMPAVAIPQIVPNGIISASAFGGLAAVAPGSWIEIYGTNLAPDTRGWRGSDFNGLNAPTSLDATSVSIGGQAAFVAYISPGQVNVQVPSTLGLGPQSVTVTNGSGTSSSYVLDVSAAAPGLLAPGSFDIGGTQYVVALFPDNATYVLPVGAIPGVVSRPAKPGDVIVLYGVGFGPVTPNISAGQLVEEGSTLTSNLQVSIGDTPCTLEYEGLAPGEIGLYQFNLVVPNVTAGEAIPFTFSLGGVVGTQTLYIPVQN